MVVDTNDWRLRGQQKYLHAARLKRERYAPFKDGWSHDHCEFCNAKFCLDLPECLLEGYCTEDYYRWICEPCFNDFRELFEFQLIEGQTGS